MPEITAKAKLDRVTKNKLRYAEVGEDGNPIEEYKNQKVGTIYLPKDFFGGEQPERIEVTVKAEVL